MTNPIKERGLATVEKIINNASEEMEELLRQKYSREFKVLTMKYVNLSNPSLCIYFCCPTDDESIVFQVDYDKKTGQLNDDYLSRLINSKAEKYVYSFLSEKGVECSVIAYFSIPITQNVEVPFELLIQNNKGAMLTFNVLICDVKDKNMLYSSLLNIYDMIKQMDSSIQLASKIWVFNRQSYDLILKERKSAPDISDTVLDNLEPIGSTILALVDGELNMDEEQFFSEMHL